MCISLNSYYYNYICRISKYVIFKVYILCTHFSSYYNTIIIGHINMIIIYDFNFIVFTRI